MLNNQLVYLGAVEWTNPAWRKGFYPEDMPEDWLLSYYNTQYQTVYVPSDVWQRATGATWARWLHDTQDGFVFVLEPGKPDVAPPASERVVVAESGWASDHLWWLDEAPDMRALSRCITEHAAAGEPLFVISRSGDLRLMEQVASLKQVMGY